MFELFWDLGCRGFMHTAGVYVAAPSGSETSPSVWKILFQDQGLLLEATTTLTTIAGFQHTALASS